MTTSIPKNYFTKEKQASNPTMFELKFPSLAEMGYRLDHDTGVWVKNHSTEFAYSDGDEEEKYIFDALHTSQDVSCSSDELPSKIKDRLSQVINNSIHTPVDKAGHIFPSACLY